MRSGNHYAPLFAGLAGDSFPCAAGGYGSRCPRARTSARQAPGVRHRQGRRRQVDGRARARDRGRAARAADDRRRAERAGARGARRSASTTAASARRSQLDGRPVRDLGRHGARAGGVPARARQAASATCSPRSRAFHALRAAHARDARADDDRQGVGAGAGPAPHRAARRRYDLVIVDAPATGHGLGALRAPRDVRRDRARRPDRPPGRARSTRRCATRRTRRCVAVALPEEMPVNETLDAARSAARRARAGARRASSSTRACPSASARDRRARSPTRSRRRPASRVARAALRAALSEHARASGQREQVARLAEGLGARAARAALPVRRPRCDRGGARHASPTRWRRVL